MRLILQAAFSGVAMRPLIAQIDLSAIRHNYALAKRCAPGRQAFAVVKANAYGHGLSETVVALQAQADGFAVACLEEAVQVRNVASHSRILLLQGCFDQDEYGVAAELGLDIVIQTQAQIDQLLTAPLPKPMNVWLKLNSGMHRLGFPPQTIPAVHDVMRQAEQVAELNLISHFACADERHPMTSWQLEQFLSLSPLPFDHRSLANSAAILTFAPSHMDWIRPGIMLYGASPFQDLTAAELGLQPAMSLNARLISIHEVAAGESVGYGGDWVAERPSRIGTVSCGYADGYPRQAPSGTPVWVKGCRARLAGRVSMDMLAVDLTEMPDPRLGDPVQLWGDRLPVDEVAHACGTIGYELLSKVTARVPRQYLE